MKSVRILIFGFFVLSTAHMLAQQPPDNVFSFRVPQGTNYTFNVYGNGNTFIVGDITGNSLYPDRRQWAPPNRDNRYRPDYQQQVIQAPSPNQSVAYFYYYAIPVQPVPVEYQAYWTEPCQPQSPVVYVQDINAFGFIGGNYYQYPNQWTVYAPSSPFYNSGGPKYFGPGPRHYRNR